MVRLEHLSAEDAPVARCSAALSAEGKWTTPHSDFWGPRRAGSLPTLSFPLHFPPHAPRPPSHVSTARKEGNTNDTNKPLPPWTPCERENINMNIPEKEAAARDEGCSGLGKSHPSCLSPRSVSCPGTSVCASANWGDDCGWVRLGRHQTHPILAILGAGYTRVPFRPGFCCTFPHV